MIERARTQTNSIRTIRPRFAPDIRFEVRPVAAVPFRKIQETDLDRLKGRLLREALTEHNDAVLNPLIRRAANEAEALVWNTPFPLLFFPTLFEERVHQARTQALRQKRIRSRSQAFMSYAR